MIVNQQAGPCTRHHWHFWQGFRKVQHCSNWSLLYEDILHSQWRRYLYPFSSSQANTTLVSVDFPVFMCTYLWQNIWTGKVITNWNHYKSSEKRYNWYNVCYKWTDFRKHLNCPFSSWKTRHTFWKGRMWQKPARGGSIFLKGGVKLWPVTRIFPSGVKRVVL